jgi:DNA-binding GntR family transcriptional regulator
MALTPTTPARFRTKQEFVYRTLRDEIMSCALPPGQRLVIDDLARRLEVSAIPVREALQTLQSEGLVLSVPHVGATVSPISRADIDEVFAVMEGLEMVAMRGAAERMTEEDARGLGEVVVAMDEAAAQGRHEEWADLNTRFHLAISRLSAMPMLQEMTERVLRRWDRVRRFYFSGVLVHRIEQAQGEHRELFAAMRVRDHAALEGLVKKHNRGAHVAYTEYLRTHPVEDALAAPGAQA